MLMEIGGWKFYDNHPESGVSSFCNIRAVHNEGREVCMWAGIVEGSANYDISPEDDFSVEVTDEDGDLIEGESFEHAYEAEKNLLERLVEYNE